MLTDTARSPYAKVSPIPFGQISLQDGFWKVVADRTSEKTVPQLRHMFESKEISHVVENFRICAGETEGSFDGTDFGDGDFYKWMEAAVYAAVSGNDQKLLEDLEGYIDLIGRAQQPDGYISTKQIISEREGKGAARFANINDFEVYNFGHLFTTAALYKRLTGRNSFVKVAEKAADYLKKMYEDSARKGEVKTAVCPSHYMGLLELYRATGEKKYLELAKQAIVLRDSVKEGLDDNQDRIPVKQHEKIIGHAVRANYLYAGLADLCLEEKDEEYLAVLDKVWDNLVNQKIYLTGGCGALYNGASPYGNFFHHQLVHQAYGYEYQLPNTTAYNETCASIGLVFWAYRMFQLNPRAEYFDMIERVMLNTNLAAVSMDGKKFFYENMLRREKEMPYELVWPLTRSEYILSYCCPPNLARTLEEAAEYAWLQGKDCIYAGMYEASKAQFRLENGADFEVIQTTGYPFEETIQFRVVNHRPEVPAKICLRIPAWCRGAGLLTDGKREALIAGPDGYVSVEIGGCPEQEFTLVLPMEARLTAAHSYVEENSGQAAVERGPLVYCLEGVDAGGADLADLYLPLNASFTPEPYEIQGQSMMALRGRVKRIQYGEHDRNALYQTLDVKGFSEQEVRLIPYYAWDNREFGEMRVFLQVAMG
ncbi:MAG: glycoside hydrolase family 127 protein [Candidatus Limivivens sp.]|nr:glycoside hydrolase family 127 protein [Candidatus Limivivens sp.]